MCEGLNHGAGLERALDNVVRIAEEWRAFGIYEVKTVQIQLRLF